MDSKIEYIQELSQQEIDEVTSRYPNLSVVHQSLVRLGMSKIRDKNTDLKEFRQHSNRVIRLIIEFTLAGFAERSQKESPICKYDSYDINEKEFIGVTILRGGNAFLDELVTIFPSIPIGMILVQRDETTLEKKPIFYFSKLPKTLQDKKILICDPMLATGGTIICAINELLKHGVVQENITFMNVICWEGGIQKVFEAFPNIKVITGSIDRQMLPNAKYIAPGLGDFGCRYYGTWEN